MSTPNLLDRYTQFLTELDGNPFDLMPDDSMIDVPAHARLNGPGLQPFASNNAGCRLALWRTGGHELVVWMDMEASPCGPFAPDAQNFFTLLPYGSGALYDMIKQTERAMNKGGMLPVDMEVEPLEGEVCALYETTMGMRTTPAPLASITSCMQQWWVAWQAWVNAHSA